MMAARLIVYARWLAIVVIVLCVALIIARWKLPMRERRSQSTLRFWLDVWRRLRGRRQDRRERSASLRALRGKSVMIVDPRDKSARVMTWELERLGCSVARAKSGTQALNRARQAKPGVIIADALLPDMPAIEFFNTLGIGDVVVVFVGVLPNQWDELRSLGRNVGCLPQSYDPEEAAALAGRLCLGADGSPEA